MRKVGKKGREWERVRRAWKQANPPDHAGYYTCGVCGFPVHESVVTIDHIHSRSSSPQSFRDWSNFQPAHQTCNNKKGSRRMTPVISGAEYELKKKLDL